MVIFMDLHPMQASFVSSHGLPKIKEYPPKLDLSCRTMKSTGYSQEYKEIMAYSIIPLGLIVDRPVSCKTVEVSRRKNNPRLSIVSLFITLIATPKSIKLLGMRTSLI